MATIKSYTSLEQSKKLAEILSIDTADMCYYEYTSHIDGTPKVGYKEGITEGIPCWSLASLLNILPRIDIEKEICSNDTYDYRVKAYIGDGYIGNWHNDLVDACMEMILELYKHKML